MAGETIRFRNPAGHAGLVNNLVSLANALVAFFETRIGLFVRESKTAVVHLLLLAGAVVAALILIASGYVFLIVSLIFGIAHTFGISWVWIALAAALVHFALAVGCGLFARSQLTKPMFHASMDELKRDRAWLKNVDKTNQNQLKS
ncbi:MAG: phage holin family protein [Verrucomicrobiota bacterium]|nr:phage holin family protein [Verrucomicrobiota bacterium]